MSSASQFTEYKRRLALENGDGRQYDRKSVYSPARYGSPTSTVFSLKKFLGNPTSKFVEEIQTFKFEMNSNARGLYREWYRLTSSANGTILAAIDRDIGSGEGYIWISTNSGITWSQNTNPGLKPWTNITCSNDGTKMAAVTEGDYIYTSNDSGVNWTQRISLGTISSSGVCYSGDGSLLFVCSYYSPLILYRSSDSGSTWTTITEPDPDIYYSFTSLACSSDGRKLVGADNFSGLIYTSSDSGNTWTARSAGTQGGQITVASSSDGTKLAASNIVDNTQKGYIYTSSDSGLTWTRQTSAGETNWASISSSADGKKLAAVVSAGYIYTSEDSGLSWTAQTSLGDKGWFDIASSSDGNKIVVVESPGYIYTGGYS